MNTRPRQPRANPVFPALVLTLAFQAAAAGAAQPAAAPPAPPAAVKPDANPLAFADGAIVFDVDWRLRAERRENDRDFNENADGLQDTEALLSRLRLGLALTPLPWLKLYAQGQDTRETWSGRGREPNVNSAQGNAEFDLRQGFVDLADYAQCPFGLSLGRQLFRYGDGRLIADSRWGNFGRSFDGAKLRYRRDRWWAEAFWARVVTIERGAFDEWKDDESVAGLYLSSEHLEGHVLDLYGFHFDSDSGSAEGRYATLGTRVASKRPKEDPWDYAAELATQFGSRTSAGRDLDIAALMIHAEAGHTFRNTPWRPRIGLSYDFASGDGDRTDGDSATFRTPYTTSHSWYGRQDIIGLANLHNPRLTLAVEPAKALRLAAEYNLFRLADSADYAYGSNGLTPVRRTTPDGRDVRAIGASRSFGQEIDLIADVTVTKNVMLHAGFSWFFAGSYLSDTGAADNGTYCYLQATVKF